MTARIIIAPMRPWRNHPQTLSVNVMPIFGKSQPAKRLPSMPTVMLARRPRRLLERVISLLATYPEARPIRMKISGWSMSPKIELNDIFNVSIVI